MTVCDEHPDVEQIATHDVASGDEALADKEGNRAFDLKDWR